MDGLIGLGGTLAMILGAGLAIGLGDRRRFAAGRLVAAMGLVAVNDACLTRLYGLMPDLIPAASLNWQGKALALAVTLAIAALPAFGWRRTGLTLAQAPGSLRAALPVLAAYCGFFAAMALAFPNGEMTREDVAFQLTMPGLEEEAFYRGLLLFALDRAFGARWRFAGVDWGWGAVLSCALFGLTHAFGYSDDGFAFDPLTMALTAIPSFVAVWLRLRTGSLLLPAVAHNFGNTVMTVA